MNPPELSNQYGDQVGPPQDPGERDPLLRNAPRHSISPEESVYSAILFCPAISRLKDGTETNRSARLALFLVILNAILQMGVVQVINIYDHNNRAERTRTLMPISDIVSEGKNKDVFERGLADTTEGQNKLHRSFLPPNEKAQLDNTKDIVPLCQRIGDGNGTFTCMPHSVLFVYEWKNLDTNADGIWTFEEAHHDVNKVKARLHVSPETIFNNMLNGLHMTARYWDDFGGNRTFYLSKGVHEGNSIPKAYFQYWAGDAMMCSLFDSSSCEAAAKASVFQEALFPGRLSAGAKGIHDLDSAIQYCYRMLQPGGGCETLLPTDFKRNREQRWGRCGTRSLVEGGKYINPYQPDQSVHVLAASYSTVQSYERATSRLFLFFLTLVIMLWLLSLVDEVKELIKFGEFLLCYPGIQPGTKGGCIIPANEENGTDMVFQIDGLSKKHRAVMVIVFVARVLVCVILANFGTRFLLVETDYLNLVLNSLALTFILTIDSMLYALVEKNVTGELMCAKDLEFVSRLPSEGCRGYILKKECWGLFLVPVLSMCIVVTFNYRNKEPVLVALRCACLQEGQKCLDSMQYQGGWWLNYWSKVLPSATHQIEALRIAGA